MECPLKPRLYENKELPAERNLQWVIIVNCTELNALRRSILSDGQALQILRPWTAELHVFILSIIRTLDYPDYFVQPQWVRIIEVRL